MAIETHNRIVYEREGESYPSQAASGPSEAARETAIGGSALAWLFGLASIVLSILGLLHVASFYMAAIAGITAGAALLAESGGAAAWYGQFTGRFAEARDALSGEAMGGVAGIVLSILALFGLSAGILLPVAVLVLGTSLFLTSWTSAGEAKFLTGLAALVLGILALVGFQPLVLSLVGLLCLGCGTLFSGATFTSN